VARKVAFGFVHQEFSSVDSFRPVCLGAQVHEEFLTHFVFRRKRTEEVFSQPLLSFR